MARLNPINLIDFCTLDVLLVLVECFKDQIKIFPLSVWAQLPHSLHRAPNYIVRCIFGAQAHGQLRITYIHLTKGCRLIVRPTYSRSHMCALYERAYKHDLINCNHRWQPFGLRRAVANNLKDIAVECYCGSPLE